MSEDPALYGIARSNRSNASMWGKNCFNSAFPTALACWMRDNNIPAVYIDLDDGGNIRNRYLNVSEVFGTEIMNSEIEFRFETTFAAYQEFAFDDITGIDLVIAADETEIRPLEIKLTVVPDSTTADGPEDKWSAELVIRPASTQFCALGMAHSTKDYFRDIKSLLEPVCSAVQHWDNSFEMMSKLSELQSVLEIYQKSYRSFQKPFLLHPIWKTQGKSAALADPAFDLIVWSDHALCKAFRTNADPQLEDTKPSRFARATFRLARVLWEIAHGSKTSLGQIYTQMTFGHQTDKEFSFNGKILRRFVTADELHHPRVPQRALTEIILNDGHKRLSPERRFDASLFFTASNVFDRGR